MFWFFNVSMFWFCFLSNRMKTLPSCALLRKATKRLLNYYCALEQMLISKTKFVIFIDCYDYRMFYLFVFLF